MAKLSDIISIETSSDLYQLYYPKENVLSWGLPNWHSKKFPIHQYLSLFYLENFR
jgi:hypothetical protein